MLDKSINWNSMLNLSIELLNPVLMNQAATRRHNQVDRLNSIDPVRVVGLEKSIVEVV